jgi:hypothetical protein
VYVLCVCVCVCDFCVFCVCVISVCVFCVCSCVCVWCVRVRACVLCVYVFCVICVCFVCVCVICVCSCVCVWCVLCVYVCVVLDGYYWHTWMITGLFRGKYGSLRIFKQTEIHIRISQQSILVRQNTLNWEKSHGVFV